MVKIYTKKGDGGTTSLYGGDCVRKCDPRVDAYGSFDELNSFLGYCAASMEEYFPEEQESLNWILAVQEDLFTLGAWLASPKASKNICEGKDPWTGVKIEKLRVDKKTVAEMEKRIDSWTRELEPLKHFILPGGSFLGAQLHIARAVCRRAERNCVLLQEKSILVPEIIFTYMNRLSDALFVLARFFNKKGKKEEAVWTS